MNKTCSSAAAALEGIVKDDQTFVVESGVGA